MKNLRNIASLLLLLTGLIHISLFFEITLVPEALIMLAFGIIYAVIGALLYKKAIYSPILGVVFPAVGILFGLLVLDPSSMERSLGILLLIIDLAIVVCCVMLLVRKEPGA